MVAVCYLLRVGGLLLCVVRCLLLAGYSCVLFAVCRLLYVVCRLLFGVYYLLCVDWCVLRVDCCSFVVLFVGACLICFCFC